MNAKYIMWRLSKAHSKKPVKFTYNGVYFASDGIFSDVITPDKRCFLSMVESEFVRLVETL